MERSQAAVPFLVTPLSGSCVTVTLAPSTVTLLALIPQDLAEKGNGALEAPSLHSLYYLPSNSQAHPPVRKEKFPSKTDIVTREKKADVTIECAVTCRLCCGRLGGVLSIWGLQTGTGRHGEGSATTSGMALTFWAKRPRLPRGPALPGLGPGQGSLTVPEPQECQRVGL